MFDIFREDLQTPDGGRTENDYFRVNTKQLLLVSCNSIMVWSGMNP